MNFLTPSKSDRLVGAEGLVKFMADDFSGPMKL